jgi:signal transduction histidine kinase
MALSDIREFSGLAETMNQMAEQLQQRMDEINSQRKTEAVLSSMREGVIATDMEQQVISINQTASSMFNIPMETVFGRSVLEVIRNHEFQEFMDRSLSPLVRASNRTFSTTTTGSAYFKCSMHAVIGFPPKAHGRVAGDQRCDPVATVGKHAA